MIYTARCEVCGASHTYVRKIADRYDTPICHDKPTAKTLDAPMVSANNWQGHKGYQTYEKGGKPVWIESAQDEKSFLKRNNLVPQSEGEQEVAIQSKARENANDKKLDAAVEQAVQTHLM